MYTKNIQSMAKKMIYALAFLMFFSMSANAQKIATVDVNLILESMEDYKTAQEDLDRVAAKWRRQIAEEYDDIKGMYNKYQAEQVLLSEDARKQKEDEIMNKEKQVREMQREKFGPEGALFLKREELVRPLQDMVYTAIEDYANARGYDFIFDKGSSSGMIFMNEEYDKTDEILKRLGIE